MTRKTTTPKLLVSDDVISSRASSTNSLRKDGHGFTVEQLIRSLGEWVRDTYETDRRSHLSRIQELEDQVKALRDVGGVMAGILTKHAADVGVRDLGEVEAVTAWDNLTASKPSNNNTGS